MSHHYYICLDNGPQPHHWYRASGLDTADDTWRLKLAKALPEHTMYLGRVDLGGRYQWLSMTSPGFWAWWDMETEQPPVLNDPLKASGQS